MTNDYDKNKKIHMQYPDIIPAILASSDTSNMPQLYEMSLRLKNKIFPIKNGDGDRYLRYNLLFNKENTGITQKLLKAEGPIMERAKLFISANEKKTASRSEFSKFYKKLSQDIITIMHELDNPDDINLLTEQ